MSLANRLSLYISLIIIVIFCAIGFLFMQDVAEREERFASLYANVIVDGSVDKLDSEISRVEYHLVNTAPLFENKLGDTGAIMPMVERFVTSDSLIMGGCVALLPAHDGEPKIMEYVSLDPEGRPVGKHLGSKDYDYTTMPWFTNALKADSPVWSDPYFDKGGGNKMMVTCSYPLHVSNGKTVGVLTADVSLDRLSSEIARLRPIDRLLSAMAFELLASLLREVVGISRDHLVIIYDSNGKPSIKGHSDLHVSLSHCEKGVIEAVADTPVGCDIEVINPTVEENLMVAGYCYSAREKRMISVSVDPAAEFTRIWTVKEALFKLDNAFEIECTDTALLENRYFPFNDIEVHSRITDSYVATIAIKKA